MVALLVTNPLSATQSKWSSYCPPEQRQQLPARLLGWPGHNVSSVVFLPNIQTHNLIMKNTRHTQRVINILQSNRPLLLKNVTILKSKEWGNCLRSQEATGQASSMILGWKRSISETVGKLYLTSGDKWPALYFCLILWFFWLSCGYIRCQHCGLELRDRAWLAQGSKFNPQHKKVAVVTTLVTP